MKGVISDFNRVIAETLCLLGCRVTWLGNISPTFRRKVPPPYSGLRVNSRTHNPEYEGSKFLRNVGKAAQQPRRPCSSIGKHDCNYLCLEALCGSQCVVRQVSLITRVNTSLSSVSSSLFFLLLPRREQVCLLLLSLTSRRRLELKRHSAEKKNTHCFSSVNLCFSQTHFKRQVGTTILLIF
jgi:hypothetical protein